MWDAATGGGSSRVPAGGRLAAGQPASAAPGRRSADCHLPAAGTCTARLRGFPCLPVPARQPHSTIPPPHCPPALPAGTPTGLFVGDCGFTCCWYDGALEQLAVGTDRGIVHALDLGLLPRSAGVPPAPAPAAAAAAPEPAGAAAAAAAAVAVPLAEQLARLPLDDDGRVIVAAAPGAAPAKPEPEPGS